MAECRAENARLEASLQACLWDGNRNPREQRRGRRRIQFHESISPGLGEGWRDPSGLIWFKPRDGYDESIPGERALFAEGRPIADQGRVRATRVSYMARRGTRGASIATTATPPRCFRIFLAVGSGPRSVSPGDADYALRTQWRLRLLRRLPRQLLRRLGSLCCALART